MTDLVESAWVELPELTQLEAQALDSLGRELSASMPTLDSDERQSSVIQCRRLSNGSWQVRVSECVGVIGTGERSWVVGPKIPLPHLLHLMQQGGTLPRTTDIQASLAGGNDIWRVLFEWLLTHVERLLKRDLAEGYVEETRVLSYLRGTVDGLALARGLLRGQTQAVCHFEEYRTDVAVNRLLKTALGIGLRTGMLDEVAALRTRRLLARFEDISEAGPHDLRVRLDRHTQRYGVAVELARHVIQGKHRELQQGGVRAFCYLWPTPAAVEMGIRAVVASALEGLAAVHKTPKSHGSLSFNADLVIGATAVGDVKYSLEQGAWRRGDVNQLLAFSVAYERDRAILLNFATHATEPRMAQAARVELTRFSWNVGLPPMEAEKALAGQVREWLLP